jgi:hypothetical protein
MRARKFLSKNAAPIQFFGLNDQVPAGEGFRAAGGELLNRTDAIPLVRLCGETAGTGVRSVVNLHKSKRLARTIGLEPEAIATGPRLNLKSHST